MEDTQEKYWSDYTKFIKITEASTGLSPSDLIDRYEILVTELETKQSLEWIYENTQDKSTITIIHELINHELLKDNILKNEFAEKIHDLDARMKKFLIPLISNDENWWAEFKEDKINWTKAQ